MWHQLTVFLLEVGNKFSHGVIDGICRTIMNICDKRLLKYGDNLLNDGLLDPVTSQNSCISLLCVILIFEFAWVVDPPWMISGPGRVG